LLCLPVAARKPLLRLPKRLLLLLKLPRLPRLLLPKFLLTLPLRLPTLLLRPKPRRTDLGNEVDSAKPAQAACRPAGLFYWHT
jgi:hypothetical protein